MAADDIAVENNQTPHGQPLDQHNHGEPYVDVLLTSRCDHLVAIDPALSNERDPNREP